MKKIKQISFFSALVLIVGGTIGAGIFFKNKSVVSDVQGSLALAITAWSISGIGAIAMALSLVEMSSASKDDRGILGWAKNFTSNLFNKTSVNYMLFIYLPTNLLILPIFAIMSLQDATLWNLNAWTVGLIAFFIFLWFTLLGFFSLKASEKIGWLLTFLKGIPLILAPVLALIHGFETGGIKSQIPNVQAPLGLAGVSPSLGLFAALPAIMFAFDGFYTVTSLKSDLKNPNKMGTLVALGLTIVTLIYLAFAIGMSLGGAKATWQSLFNDKYKKMYIILNSLIFTAVVGLFNGYTMVQWRIYLSTAEAGDFNLLVWFKNKFKIKSLKLASLYFILTAGTLVYITCLPVGIYIWNGTSSATAPYYSSAATLYDFIDVLGNYTTLMVFLVIGVSIFGALKNRKTKNVNVKKEKYFLPSAIIALVFIGVALAVQLTISIVDMTGYNGADSATSIVKFCIFLFSLIITMVPAYFSTRKAK